MRTGENDSSSRNGTSKRLGIKQIAAEAGVSIATVSRVINGRETVDPRLRDQVLEAIDRLDYRPNGIARSLRLRRTATLGAVIPSITNPYFTEVVRAMQDTATEYGYTLLVTNSDRDVAKEEAALAIFLDRQVDGVVLVSAATGSEPSVALRALLDHGTPIVALDRALTYLDLDQVTVNTRSGAREAVAHLVARGRRRIAFLAGPPSIFTATEKLAGYRDGLAEAGLPEDDALIFPGDYTVESGETQALALLALRSRPDALLVANNLMTLGAIRVLLRQQIAIPQEIAVVGYDDVPWTDVVRPTVTVVSQPTYELGKRAIELLVARLTRDGVAPSRANEVLPTLLIVREST